MTIVLCPWRISTNWVHRCPPERGVLSWTAITLHNQHHCANAIHYRDSTSAQTFSNFKILICWNLLRQCPCGLENVLFTNMMMWVYSCLGREKLFLWREEFRNSNCSLIEVYALSQQKRLNLNRTGYLNFYLLGMLFKFLGAIFNPQKSTIHECFIQNATFIWNLIWDSPYSVYKISL